MKPNKNKKKNNKKSNPEPIKRKTDSSFYVKSFKLFQNQIYIISKVKTDKS